AVKDSSEEINSRLLVSRYGGDEFLVAGFNCSQEEIDDLKKRLREKIEEKNRTNNYPFTLSISMGTAVDICGSSDDIERLLRTADEAMYAEKALKKKNA
ncbi:MAG: diguanylate cyclase domain-containing protein, partial [Christensenellales bacterium]